MKSFFKKFILLFLLLIIYAFISAFSYTKAVSQKLSDNIFRLHVIANSNSEEDQNLKYKVRDCILEYFKSISLNLNNKEEVVNLIQQNLSNIENIAQEKIYAEGFNYPVEIEIGNFYFPTKTYGDISFPPGYYDSLRIKIGNSSGENWWCVMFPALCFVSPQNGVIPQESKEYLEEVLSEEEYKLISEESTNTNIKFKFVELLQNISNSGIFI